MGKSLLFGLFLMSGTLCYGQSNEEFNLFSEVQQPSESGSLVIAQDFEIEDIVNIHLDVNKRNTGVDGFRVQLFLGSNYNAKKESQEVKTEFLSLMPDESIYVMYEAPFWRVQAGDFRSKNEALVMYNKLKKDFPSCYPVPVKNVDYNKFK
ncbi:SPOR domain-containing protein [Saccharicrinis aurantiacus]|uniref:SPOR domain-containing protein n=1 Tax=Saccharicrinis aurantiacus TaxID=1849719 RepID=UPI0024903B5F|nr:SPOR domain-containing protein [Saccharicrinis aurantiacus]